MSGASSSSYRESWTKSYLDTNDEKERLKRLSDRRLLIEKSRDEIPFKRDVPRPTMDLNHLIQCDMVRKGITRPKYGVKRVYTIMIDNSGSNEQIATRVKGSTGYIAEQVRQMDPEAQVLFVYFSDHCDAANILQAIDFISFTEEGQGESILASTIHYGITGASGGDEPEAHECVLWDLCHIDFGSALERHLIMATDVVGHGMGMAQLGFEDKHCPKQREWQESLDKVEDVYTSFEVIGCGYRPHVAKLQEQFVSYRHPEKVATNFINFAHIKEHGHRIGIVPNAILFLIARHCGVQTVEGFLGRVYLKWIADPIFKDKTDAYAKEAIIRFAKYIPISEDERIEMMHRVLETPVSEIKVIMQMIQEGRGLISESA